MKNTNFILETDSYKTSHFEQYPEDTKRVFSYIEPRDSQKDVVFFGLQAYLKRIEGKVFDIKDIYEAERIINAHGGRFNKIGWLDLYDAYDGMLPITICALPEGTVHKGSLMQVSITNTDNRFPWLVSYMETALLRAVWYPSTVASNSYAMKKKIESSIYLTGSGDAQFKLHDFGARGVSSSESATLGGMAHLVNFSGTDTLEGIMGAEKYYGSQVSGFSIPATEHSTVTSWGRNGESEMVRKLLLNNKDNVVACVADSYDIWNFITKILGEDNRQLIEAREVPFVVRPDSGHPIDNPIKVIKRLMDTFGYTTNDTGFKVLPDYVRVIQGDGLNKDTLGDLLQAMEQELLSIDNLSFGMGGGLLQNVSRDDYNYAMKCSAIYVDEEWRDVFKDPITDVHKRSKKGVLNTYLNKDGVVVTDNNMDIYGGDINLLELAFHNGEIKNFKTFEQVKTRVSKGNTYKGNTNV